MATKPQKRHKDPAEYTTGDWLRIEQARNADAPAPEIVTPEWAAYEAEVREETGVGDDRAASGPDDLRPIEERSMDEHMAAERMRRLAG
jgi:hypothetical protein